MKTNKMYEIKEKWHPYQIKNPQKQTKNKTKEK